MELEVLEQLRDAVCETRLQVDAAKRRREAAEKDAKDSISTRDRLMPLRRLVPKVVSALRLLDAEKQRAALLSEQLREHEARACRSREPQEDTLRDVRHKEALLGEDVDRMNVLHAQLRQSLAEAQSRRLAAGEELERLRGRSGRRKEERLLDDFVSRLGVAAAVGPPRRKAAK